MTGAADLPVPEEALDHDAIMRRVRSCCGDEDFLLIACPGCTWSPPQDWKMRPATWREVSRSPWTWAVRSDTGPER